MPLQQWRQPDFSSSERFEDEGPLDYDYEMQEPKNKKLFFNLPYRFIPKRAPSGFMGMRGKKFLRESYKRGPSGFLGMRGKKSTNDPLFDLLLQRYHSKYLNNYEDPANFMEDPTGDFEKRAPANGFFGMRGKKDGNDKRSPREFFGMRGKKENAYTGYDYEGSKRSPKMGFHGMRGKRSVDYDMFAQRFVGVRGKKAFSEPLEDQKQMTYWKRAPMGFLGLRGKKSS